MRGTKYEESGHRRADEQEHDGHARERGAQPLKRNAERRRFGRHAHDTERFARQAHDRELERRKSTATATAAATAAAAAATAAATLALGLK
jgi:hypothetical protein